MCLDIMEKQWDVAIILDACRYDIFEEMHKEFFDGELTEELGANETIEWLYANFNGEHEDVTYVSGHPAGNSLGVSWGWFDASEVFGKVVDAWEKGWMKIGTTNPSIVTDAAILNKDAKRLIVHYMQPHGPYRDTGYEAAPRSRSSAIGRMIDSSPAFIRKMYWKLRFATGFRERMTAYYTDKYTDDELRELYKANMRWVLNEVSRFVRKSRRRVIITADHGELLGEDGMYFHPPFSEHPIIRKVPYMMVKHPPEVI